MRLARRVSDDTMVDIEEIKGEGLRGGSCECQCPDCGESLVAKFCKDKSDHFSHQSNSLCDSTGMTSIHLTAQQIIADNKTCFLPRKSTRYKNGPWISICEPKQGVLFSSVKLEYMFSGIKRQADIVLYYNEMPLAVEIAVTHFCEPEKINQYRSEEIASIEINLSGVDRNINKSQLEKLLLNPSKKEQILFKWLFHRKFKAASEEAYNEYLRKKEEAYNEYLRKKEAKLKKLTELRKKEKELLQIELRKKFDKIKKRAALLKRGERERYQDLYVECSRPNLSPETIRFQVIEKMKLEGYQIEN